jgi:hypothetical protein
MHPLKEAAIRFLGTSLNDFKIARGGTFKIRTEGIHHPDKEYKFAHIPALYVALLTVSMSCSAIRLSVVLHVWIPKPRRPLSG